MSIDGNLHEGHRQRLIKKFINNPNSFSEHELLEVLLFYAIPRINTNDIAHRLIRTFGSLQKVLSASEKELLTVDGIGKKTAVQIMLVGAIANTVSLQVKPKTPLKSLSKVKEMVFEYFAGLCDEKFLLILLDNRYKEITKIEFCDQHVDRVSAEIPEIANVLALHRPSYAIIAHNHPSGNVEPSLSDDLTTQKINLLCNVHNVVLIDHIIVSDKQVYSYYDKDRLSKIKKVADLDKILKMQGEIYE